MPGGETQEKQNIEQVVAPLQTADLQQSQDFIETTFKDKIDDQTLYSKVIDVFAEVRKQFPDTQIKDFLGSQSISILVSRLKMKEREDAIQYLAGKIDDKGQNETKVATYEITDKNTNTIDVSTNILNEREAATKLVEQMKNKYAGIAGDYKPNADQLAAFEKKVPAETKSTLEANGINYNDYVQYAYTAANFSDKPAVQDFAKDCKKLNEILHLPDIPPADTLDAYSNMENVGKKMEDNDNINNYISDNDNFSKMKHTDFGSLSELTGKFISQEAKDELHKYKQELAKFPDFFDKNGDKLPDANIRKLNDEAKKIYEDYTNYQEKITKEINDTLADRTNLITKQRICYAPICGLARYFDTSTLQEKNFADNFAVDKTNGISIENDTLHMKGTISNIDVNFSYNMNKNDSPLKSESTLGYDPVEQIFVPGMQTDLNVQMPGIKQLTDQANLVTDKNNITELLKNSSNMVDFEHNLKAQLGDQLMRPFGKEYIVKHRVQKNIEKNMAMKELQNQFIPEGLTQKLLQDGKINKEEKNSRQTMEIWNASLQRMSLSDIEKTRELTDKTKLLVEKNDFGFLKSPATEKMLKDMKDDKNGEGMATFFSWISDPDSKIINLHDWENLVTMGQKNDDLAMNMSKMSGNFEKKLAEEEAQKLLENISGEKNLA